jgi:hypothetical protein
VPEAVVDALEPVEVHVHHRDLVARVHAPLDRVLDPVEERGAVG